MIDLEKREGEILNSLKDFQLLTVKRICGLYEKGQNRVLVADEVGLGKTLIAKGVIVKTALMHQKMGDDLFKVAYICSNQNIARQNVMKLKIDTGVTVDKSNDTRLSMQHLKFFEQRKDEKIIENYVQLIPLTPSTSFNMTGGIGTVWERSLIYAILKRLSFLKENVRELEKLLRNDVSSWDYVKEKMEDKVLNCDSKNNGEYLTIVTEKVNSALNGDYTDLSVDLLNALSRMSKHGEKPGNYYNIINRLRKLMATISIEFLEPDLVIMDEFQRFRELIDSKGESEMTMLAKKFLYSGKVKTLLLSATPYKLYSTLEEIDENNGADEHYNEFMQVIDFLFDKDEVKQRDFRVAWKSFSDSLKHVDKEDWEELLSRKEKAEGLMYEGICRTERLAVSKSGDAMIDTEKSKESLEITQNDVLSYIEGERVATALKELGSNVYPPVEFVKSAPYIFSFMEHYKLKKELRSRFLKEPSLLKVFKGQENGWLKRKLVGNYEKVPVANARLERLMKETFDKNSELFMWIPPALPYYEFGGAYKNSDKFSKILVFSAWEMVPRMIATLVSYEAERKTIGRLVEKDSREEKHVYFPSKGGRTPRGRLNLGMNRNEPARMSLFSLMYPSLALTKLFNPIEVLNNKKSRKTIEKELSEIIEVLKATAVQKYQSTNEGPTDERWYWAAPVIFDAMFEKKNCNFWFDYNSLGTFGKNDEEEGYGETEGKANRNMFEKHFEMLKETFKNPESLKLGPPPQDLTDILILQTLGSPGVCSLRMAAPDTKNDYSYKFGMEGALMVAREIIRRFNSPEATAIVELLYSSEYSRKKNKEPDEYHWINVLKYCADGNLQAVLDEYRHILVEAYGLKDMEGYKRSEEVAKLISSSLKAHTASYKVDTFDSFASKNRKEAMSMRSHYAAGFYNSSKEEKVAQRTESLRQSFNSPFRPFVLATTSIGQEGLDFHFYCRKIMHWNLPSNPIDLEQREGRVSRYKGLAIRQNISNRYGSTIFKSDIWDEMFEKCKELEKGAHCELVPYWYLEPDREKGDVYIERIVPMYPMSKDKAQYERLIKILSLYRITLGQARQEELIANIFDNLDEERRKEIHKLFINLSPYYKRGK